MTVALAIEGLAIARGGRTLFSGLDVRIGSGACVELTGPNGAGKTSLLRALAGFLPPIAGAIRFEEDGAVVDLADRPARLHLLGHRDGLKGSLDARAHLAFWRGVLGGGGTDDATALDRVGLTAMAPFPTRAYSAGQGRRLALARLLVSPRPVWLLDEPAAALDRAGKELLRSLIAAHRAEGGIVIAAVHEPLEVLDVRTIAIGAVA